MPRRGKFFILTAATLLLVSSCSAGLYFKLAGNITSQPMNILGNRPEQSAADAQGRRPMNILALGSQTRDGQQGSAFGNSSKLGTDISDTAMLIHLSADRKHAIVTSIPRDLVVPRPDCVSRKDPKQTVPGAGAAMFDLAMTLGGPPCAVATVEHMGGIRVDHFIRLDFNGFRKMVNAVGGVEVCVPYPGIHDWRSHLNISPGKHVIKDQEALAFVRDRHGVGDGGDLGRIKMQQMFVSSLIQKMESAGVLGNPVTLLNLANTATSALTVDPGLATIDKLAGLGSQLRNLKTHDITFVTAPNGADPTDQNRVIPSQPAFDAVFRLLKADQPWTGRLPSNTPARGSSGSGSGSGSVSGAGSVKVKVLNATGTSGKAATVRTELQQMGFDVVAVGTAAIRSTTTISAGTGSDVLRSVVSGSPRTALAGTPGVITLTVGLDFSGIHKPDTQSKPSAQQSSAAPSGPTISASGVQTRSADTNICSALPTPRSDAAQK